MRPNRMLERAYDMLVGAAVAVIGVSVAVLFVTR